MVSAGPSCRGKLLVASPLLADPNFARTVVLIIEHNEEAAMGVVLNRPSHTPLSELIEPLSDLAAPPGLVHLGGPVAPSAAVCLGRLQPGRSPEEASGAQVVPLFDGLVSVDPEGDLALLGGLVQDVRLFAGYAGWGPGQLEGELELGGWYVVPSLPADAVTPRAEDLWRAVLRRQGPPLALLSNFPLKPSLN
ncbi:MAG TPA: YqgE/AlgH family protein [Acidimicrobiales bacterium]|nr:YqgE/AlgH family protein [Acidimicrobiales bacterium]